MIDNVQKSIDKMTEYWYQQVPQGAFTEQRPVELGAIEEVINKVLLSESCVSSDKVIMLMSKWEGFVRLWISNIRGVACQD